MNRIIALLLVQLLLPCVAAITDLSVPYAYADSDGEGDSDGESSSDGEADSGHSERSGDEESSTADESGSHANSSSSSSANSRESGESESGLHGTKKPKNDKPHQKKPRKSHQKSIRNAVQKNQILPLNQIKARIKKQLSSEIISIDLEQKESGWVYEFKVINKTGHLLEVYVDAKSGRILRSKNEVRQDD